MTKEPTQAPFVYRRRVHFSDTDMAGICHFSSFFRFMEEAEHAFLRTRGLGVFMKCQDETISFPRVSVKCDYHSPARFEDELDIAVTLAELGPKAVTYQFAMTLAGRRVATGQTVAVCCRWSHDGGAPRLASMPVPPDIVAKLTQTTP